MPDATQPSVLLLDPSSAISRTLTRKLESLNCRVHVENMARRAANAAADHTPDVILLDLDFEDPSGVEICQAIRKTAALGDTPVIMHTNYATRSNVLRSIRSGASSVLVKPASTETIVAKIHDVLSRSGRNEVFADQVKSLLGEAAGGRGSGEGGAGPGTKGAANDEGSTAMFTESMDADARLQRLLRDAKEVKAMPYGVAKTLEVSQDERSGAAELGNVIESDPAISTMVLKRANSAHFGGQKRTTSARDAIVRLGFGETRNLVLSISIVKNFGGDTNSLGFQRGDFWEHSLAVASIAKNLARAGRGIDPDIAFVAGLVHDLGKLIFDEYVSSQYESALETAAKKSVRLAQAEREIFQINHNDVGEALMQKWRFPDDISAATRYHHAGGSTESDIQPEVLPMVRVIQVANAVAKALRLGGSGDEILTPLTAEMLSDLGLKTWPDDLADRARNDLKEYRQYLNIPPGDDAEGQRPELSGRRVVMVDLDGHPVDTCAIYLAQDWGLEVEVIDDPAAVGQVSDLADAVLIIQAGEDAGTRSAAEKLLALPDRGDTLLLEGPRSGGGGEAWEAERLTVLRTPVNGRALISALCQVCQDRKPAESATSAA